MSQRILAAVAFDQQAPGVLRTAHALSQAAGGSLAVCYVMPSPYVGSALFPHVNQLAVLQVPHVEQSARKALEDLVARELPGCEAELFIEVGGAASEVVHRADEWKAEVIVCGSHGRHGLERMLLGSVAAGIVRYAHCAVYVVRDSAGSAGVLAATDLSDPSLPALTAAAAEALRRGLPLTALYVLEPFWGSGLSAAAAAPLGISPAVPSTALQQELVEGARSTLEAAMGRAGAEGSAVVEQGTAASTIIRKAEDVGAALVVVGTRGRTGIARILMGSVAEAVVSGVSCSVLAVRSSS